MHIVNPDYSIKKRIFVFANKTYEIIGSRNMGSVKETIDTMKINNDANNCIERTRLYLYLKTRK